MIFLSLYEKFLKYIKDFFIFEKFNSYKKSENLIRIKNLKIFLKNYEIIQKFLNLYKNSKNYVNTNCFPLSKT